MLVWTAAEGANPIVPTQWEVTVVGVGVLALLLFVAAVIGIARSHHLTGLAQALWVLVVCLPRDRFASLVPHRSPG